MLLIDCSRQMDEAIIAYCAVDPSNVSFRFLVFADNGIKITLGNKFLFCWNAIFTYFGTHYNCVARSVKGRCRNKKAMQTIIYHQRICMLFVLKTWIVPEICNVGEPDPKIVFLCRIPVVLFLSSARVQSMRNNLTQNQWHQCIGLRVYERSCR